MIKSIGGNGKLTIINVDSKKFQGKPGKQTQKIQGSDKAVKKSYQTQQSHGKNCS